MKKVFAILICVLFLFTAFAVAENTADAAEAAPVSSEEAVVASAETTAEPVLISAEDTAAETAEDDSLDIEIAEFEEEETGDDVLEEIDAAIETDEEIEADLEITEEESAEIAEAAQNIGLRAYALNRQLKYRLHVRIVEAEAIIAYLEEKGIDASELQSILDELKTKLDSIDPASMTNDEHKAAVEEIKALVQSFREKARELIPEEDIPIVRQRIIQHRENARERLQEYLKAEWKARMLYNRKQFSNQLKKVREDAKQLRQDGKKLLQSAQRIRALKTLRDNYVEGKAKAEDITQKWKEEAKQYSLERAAAVVKNERAQLAVASARIRKAISEAKAAGEDAADLENQLREINAQISDFVPGKVTSAEARQKAAAIRDRIKNIEQNNKVSNRLKTAQQIRQEAMAKIAEKRPQAVTAQQRARTAVATNIATRKAQPAAGTAVSVDPTTNTGTTTTETTVATTASTDADVSTDTAESSDTTQLADNTAGDAQ